MHSSWKEKKTSNILSQSLARVKTFKVLEKMRLLELAHFAQAKNDRNYCKLLFNNI